MSEPSRAGPGLPRDSARLFPEYTLEEMDLERHRGVIIERILERGTWEQTRWLFATYGEGGAPGCGATAFACYRNAWRLALNVTD